MCVCKSCLLLARDMCQVAWYLLVLSPKHNDVGSTILSVVMLLVHVAVSWFTMSYGKLGLGPGDEAGNARTLTFQLHHRTFDVCYRN